eukprot:1331472-Pyramimonas_sp.AAC.1
MKSTSAATETPRKVTPMKAKAKAAPKPKPKSAAKVSIDEPLVRACLSGPTSGAKPRIELTAFTKSGVRVHVTTILTHLYGPRAEYDMKALAKKINDNRWSKSQCLDLRASLQSQ